MTQMNYFRRPMLAGKNLTRLLSGRVRGDLRRSDPDGFSTVPYFPGASGGTLLITTDAGAFVANITLNDFAQVIADINTALGVNGVAQSDDGCIAIQTATQGSAGFVRITGGTSSVALGFNTYGGTLPIESRGSEMPGSPEGRIGNPFGAVFPNKGENLTRDVFVRSMGRLAANSDVLWSDHVKNAATLENVSFTVSGDRKYIIPSIPMRFLTVGGNMTASTGKGGTLPFYQLIDTVTGQPADSQVQAVVRGAPVGDPPYANSPSWTDTSGKNILNVVHTKTTNGITTIKGGRIVECAGATFATTKVIAGDFAEISGATNINPWSNNGYRWVVETVLSETALILRPMSRSEMISVLTSVTDVQPIVELNDTKTSLEVFGNIIIRTGVFAHNNVNFVVRPPIPVGAVYQFRASVDGSLRNDLAYAKQYGSSTALLDLGNELDPTDNWILSGLDATYSAPNCNITAGYVRHHGKAFHIPARVLTPADFVDGFTNYVYWPESAAGLSITTNTTDWTGVLADSYLTPTNKGHPVAEVVVSGGVITSVNSMVRRRAEKDISITVGTSGQFKTLEAAVRYANAISIDSGETTSSSGSYPHYEFVVTSDLTLTQDITFEMPGVTLRGVDKRVMLTTGGQRIMISGNTTELTIKDFLIDGGTARFVSVLSTAHRVVLTNIRMWAGAGFSELIGTVGGGTLTEALIENCAFNCDYAVKANILDVSSSVVRLINSNLTSSGGGSAVLVRNASSTTWNGTKLVIDGCNFMGGWLNNTGTSSLVVEATSVTSDVLVRNTFIDLGSHGSATNGVLFTFAGRALLENVRAAGGQIPRSVAGNAYTVVRDCAFQSNVEGMTASAIIASVVENTTLTHVDTDGNSQGGVGISAASANSRVLRNTVGGPFLIGIDTTTSVEAEVSGNKVTSTKISNAAPLYGIRCGSTSNAVVSDNVVSLGAAVTAWIGVTLVSCVGATVRGNKVTFPEPTLASTTNYGIILSSCSKSVVSGNYVATTTAGSFLAPQTVKGLYCVSGNDLTVSGNTVIINGTGAAQFTGLESSAQPRSNYANNTISAYGRVFATVGLQSTVTGNTFIASSSNAPPSTGWTDTLGGEVSGNVFTSTNPGTIPHSVTISDGVFTGNIFYGIVYLKYSPSGVTFNGNQIYPTGATGFDGTTVVQISRLEMSGNDINGTCNVGLTAAYLTSDITFNGNKVSGNTKFVIADGTVVASGNILARYEVDGGAVAFTQATFANNKTSTDVRFTVTRVEVVGNEIQGGLDLLRGAESGSIKTKQIVCGNDIKNGVYTYGEDVRVDGNNINSDRFQNDSPTAQVSVLSFTNNRLNGAFFGYQTSSLASAKICNNVFEEQGGSPSWNVLAVDALVEGNSFNTKYGIQSINVTGSQVRFNNNYVYATNGTLTDNMNTWVRLVGSSALGSVWASNNFIYGRVLNDSGSAHVYFTDNYVYYMGDYPTVLWGTISASGGDSTFSGNTLYHDQGSLTDGQYGTIQIANINNTRVSNNRFVLTASASNVGAHTIHVFSVIGGSTWTQFIGNRFEKYANVVGPPAQVINYINLAANASNTVIWGNLMSAGGTVGASNVHQGGGQPAGSLPFTAGPAVLTIVQ